MSGLDRDAARKAIDRVVRRHDETWEDYRERVLDGLEACVRPAPPQDVAREVPGGQAKQVWAVYCPGCRMWLFEWNSELTEAEQVLREHQDEMHD